MTQLSEFFNFDKVNFKLIKTKLTVKKPLENI